jgi:hypothetical protein
MAFAWADDPLDRSAGWPPHVTPWAAWTPPEPALSSLPHAANRSAPAAIMPIAAARR